MCVVAAHAATSQTPDFALRVWNVVVSASACFFFFDLVSSTTECCKIRVGSLPLCVCVSLSISIYPLEMSKRPTDRDDRTNHGTPLTKRGTPLDRPSWPLTAVYRDEPGRGDALVGAAGLPTLRR